MGVEGAIILALLILVGAALIAAGVLLLRRKQDWLATGMAVVSIIVGASWLISILFALSTRTDPLPLLGTVVLTGVGVAAFSFWAIMLAECMAREEANSVEKLTWAVVILGANLVGALIYFFIRRLNQDSKAH